MTLSRTETDKAPKAIGPYSQAVVCDGWVYASGQIALDPASGAVVGVDAAAQARQALANLAAVLEASGSGLDRVVKTTLYLKDMADFQAVNEVYAAFFKAPYPARATVQAARLPKDALFEIDAIARHG